MKFAKLILSLSLWETDEVGEGSRARRDFIVWGGSPRAMIVRLRIDAAKDSRSATGSASRHPTAGDQQGAEPDAAEVEEHVPGVGRAPVDE